MPQQKAYLIELKLADGRPIFPPFYLYATELAQGSGTSPLSSSATHGRGNTSSEKKDDLMTDPQKRLLYRLLSDHGYEGERATQEIFTRLDVTTLKEVTKQDASQLIERLKEGVPA